MNRPAPISVFSDQHRTKSTTRSRTSCGTHTCVRAPQDFFLKRCARPSTRPTPRPWSGSSSPETRSVAVRLDGPGGPGPGRQLRRSRRTLFANGRKRLVAVPTPHTGQKPAPYPTGAVSGWQPSPLPCSAFAVFACVLSAILTEERPLHFQLRQDRVTTWPQELWGERTTEGHQQRRRPVSAHDDGAGSALHSGAFWGRQ